MRKGHQKNNYHLNSENLMMILGIDCYFLGFKEPPKAPKV